MGLKDSWSKIAPYFVDLWHGQYPVGIEPAGADELPFLKQRNVLWA